MDSFLDHAFAVRSSRGTRIDPHPIVLGDSHERGLYPISARHQDCGHTIHPPPPSGSPEAAQHRVDALHQMRLVLARRQPRPEPPRMGQHTHQHKNLRPPRGVAQLQPVPLAFLARRMVDHNGRLSSGSPTRRTRRPQLAASDLSGKGHVTLRVTELRCLLEQCRRPKVGILGQPLPNISLDHIERIRLGCCPLPGDPLTRKVRSYCLAVSSQMPGNSRDRPTPLPQRVYFHVFLLCQHQRWGSLSSLPDLSLSSLERTPLNVWYLPSQGVSLSCCQAALGSFSGVSGWIWRGW